MSFIPGGTSRLYLEEISEPDHFRCTQENPQHECSCLKRRMGIRVGLDSSAALKSAYMTPQGISATSNSNQRCRRFSRSGGDSLAKTPATQLPLPKHH